MSIMPTTAVPKVLSQAGFAKYIVFQNPSFRRQVMLWYEEGL